MCPRSRGGKTDEFNLFPFKIKRHQNWNEIVLNMTLQEVWNSIEEIHGSIWLNDEDVVTRRWLSVCKLRSKDELKHALNKEYAVFFLQEAWISAFGGWELPGARTFLKYMMLFMIFGSDVACADSIFDNGNLAAFFEKYPVKDERQWAFQICFGENAGWQAIKSKTSKIIRIVRKSP